jgi:hypothetical protein
MAITFGKTRRRFAVGGQQVEIVSAVTGKDYTTRVLVDGVEAGRDTTPTSGTEAFRNHAVALPLADGATLSVEAGYVGWWGMGLRSRRDGVVVDDSHPGKTFAYPESLKRLVHQPDYDPARQKANLVPIGVDIAMGLVFFFVAREDRPDHGRPRRRRADARPLRRPAPHPHRPARRARRVRRRHAVGLGRLRADLQL